MSGGGTAWPPSRMTSGPPESGAGSELGSSTPVKANVPLAFESGTPSSTVSPATTRPVVSSIGALAVPAGVVNVKVGVACRFPSFASAAPKIGDTVKLPVTPVAENERGGTPVRLNCAELACGS